MTPRSLNWLKATIIHPPAAAEAVSALLFEEGAQGVWEDQPDRRGRQVTRSGFPPDREAGLAAALPLLVARLAEAFAFDPAEFDFSLEIEENHDWAEKWKEGLKPVLIGPGLALAPTWWPEDDLPMRRWFCAWTRGWPSAADTTPAPSCALCFWPTRPRPPNGF